VDNGSRPWEAAHTLEAKEAPAMLFWVTALQYEFKKAMLLPSQIVNVRWMQYALVFLDRIKKVAPWYGNGAVELAYTAGYCVLPIFSAETERNVTAIWRKPSRKATAFCWGDGRAAGFFIRLPETGKRAAERDLQWVVEQDVTLFPDGFVETPFQEDFPESCNGLDIVHSL